MKVGIRVFNTWFDNLEDSFYERVEEFDLELLELYESDVFTFEFTKAEKYPSIVLVTVDDSGDTFRHIIAKFDMERDEFFYEISVEPGLIYSMKFTETAALMKHIQMITYALLHDYFNESINLEETDIEKMFAKLNQQFNLNAFQHILKKP